MASIFPLNPEVDDEFEGYRFDGVAWKIIGIDLTAEYPVITGGTISASAVPTSIARVESPTFTGTVGLPATTNIGDVSHTEIQTLNGVTHSIQDQVDAKQPIVSGVSDIEIGYLNGVTGSIQTQIDGKTTASYVDNAVSSAVSGVIDTAPSTLNTLNELAAALGDDPNFATTITNLIAEKISNVPGMISQYGGATAPTGWFLCEGQEVSVATYTSLYNVLTATGTVFPYGANTNGSGGAGSTHFRLPNLKGRIPVGRDSAQTEFDALGETGGVKSVTLTSAQSGLPAHSHGITDPGHAHYLNWLNNVNVANFAGAYGSIGSNAPGTTFHSTTGISINNNTAANAAEAHTNLQPYVIINYIIRY